MALTPTSELEAVNIMLSAIGESPVSSLDDPSLVDVSLALSILRETSIDIQAKGLQSNTERDFPLTPNVDGEIIVPANCAQIDTTGRSCNVDVAHRGTRLYDKEKRSFTSFTGTLYVDMVLLFDFTDLPQHVRRYITTKASRRFQTRFMGSDTLSAFTQLDDTEALVDFEGVEALNEDSNILADNYDTYKILSRWSPRRAVRY